MAKLITDRKEQCLPLGYTWMFHKIEDNHFQRRLPHVTEHPHDEFDATHACLEVLKTGETLVPPVSWRWRLEGMGWIIIDVQRAKAIDGDKVTQGILWHFRKYEI